MERTIKPGKGIILPTEISSEILPRWKKIGGGSLRIGSKIIKPGEIFRMQKELIPTQFRDVIIPVDGVVEEVKKDIAPSPVVYTLKEVKRGLFNIVNPAGKVLNEKPLEKEVADKLIEDLSK